jgi:hypothetical protein
MEQFTNVAKIIDKCNNQMQTGTFARALGVAKSIGKSRGKGSSRSSGKSKLPEEKSSVTEHARREEGR